MWRHLCSPRDMVRLNAVSDYAVARVRHAAPDSACLRASEVDPTFTASITLLGGTVDGIQQNCCGVYLREKQNDVAH